MNFINLRHIKYVKLKWTDPCPVGKEWKGIPLEDVDPSFLLWCFAQDWCYENQPALHTFVKENYDTLRDNEQD